MAAETPKRSMREEVVSDKNDKRFQKHSIENVKNVADKNDLVLQRFHF